MGAITKFAPNDSVFHRMSISEVYQLCTGYEASTHARGNKVLVRCPAVDHDDKSPSCYLLLNTNTWYCFSCPTAFSNLSHGRRTRSMADLVILNGKARNIREAAEFLEGFAGRTLRMALKPQPKPKRGQDMGKFEKLDNEKLTDTYLYRDEQGKTLYRVLRYEGSVPADATDLHAAPKNGLGKRFVMVNHHGKPRVLYNLPDVIAAARAGRSVIIVEGEKKAKWLTSLGFVATTWANGSNSPWELGWNKHFDGCPYVFLFCDSDTVGRLKMREIAQALGAQTRCIVVIDLFPDRTNGDDLMEWAEENGLMKMPTPVAFANVRQMMKRYARAAEELNVLTTRPTTYLETDAEIEA
jgi:hypothetical protein